MKMMMISTVSYFENGSKFQVMKHKTNGVQRLLVKKDGKPVKSVRFVLQTGRILKPSENHTPRED